MSTWSSRRVTCGGIRSTTEKTMGLSHYGVTAFLRDYQTGRQIYEFY